MNVTQAFTFEAAHRLPHVPATHRCHRMHGHSYRVEITVSGAVDAATGFVIDFFDLEAIAAPVIRQIDHYCLNDIAGLENPTAENIAIWIWNKIALGLPILSNIRVYETPLCWADYAPKRE